MTDLYFHAKKFYELWPSGKRAVQYSAMRLKGYSIGFTYGFLFGVVGLWILAVVSMMIPFIEFITQPLFIIGRFGGSMLEENGVGSTMDVILLVLLNGVFYGLIGMLVQWIVRKVHD